MTDLERVHIKLGLSGTYWDKRPQYRVSINDQVLSENFITADRDVTEYLEFDVEYAGDAVLKVELLNKTADDTKKEKNQEVTSLLETNCVYSFVNDDNDLLSEQTFKTDKDALDFAKDLATQLDHTVYAICAEDRRVGHSIPNGPIEIYEHPNNYVIVDDMSLNIVSIEVDDINLGQIPFTHSEYRPVDRDEVLKQFVNLGWNGAWTLAWTNPFYIWLLENM